MSTTPEPAETAYLDHRATLNAQWRWTYAAVMLCVAAALDSAYLLSGSFERDGILGSLEGYGLTFAYLGAVALAALLCGRKPLTRNPRLRTAIDNGWIALLMPGAAWLATLDAPVGDLSGYVLVSLPAALFHSAQARHSVGLQLLGLGGAVTGVMLFGATDPASAGLFLIGIGVCAAATASAAIQFEAYRRRAFMAAYTLDHANRELELRSAALLEANGTLEAGNRELASRTAELEAANLRLEELARTDPLTGVANRRQLFESIDREFGRSRRYHTELTLAVLDLDDFGQVNKMHGVIAGDEVLAEFAAKLRSHMRGVDLVARYGGEEFVVLMPDCNVAAAALLLERIRGLVAEMPLSSRHIALTFSAGVTALHVDDPDPINMLNRADAALREAKAAGKNRVVLN